MIKRRSVVAFTGLIGFVIAAEVGGKDGVAMLRKEGYLETPGIPKFGEAVQENDERAASLGYVVHANAVGDDIAVLPCFCRLHHIFLSAFSPKLWEKRRRCEDTSRSGREPPAPLIAHCKRW